MLLLETPFFEHSQPYPGRIADYPPGVRENGGQYSHGASWIVDGFVRLVRAGARQGDEADGRRVLSARAFEIFEKISPLKKTDPERIARLWADPHPAARRHLRRLGPRRARRLVVVHGLGGADAVGRLCACGRREKRAGSSVRGRPVRAQRDARRRVAQDR